MSKLTKMIGLIFFCGVLIACKQRFDHSVASGEEIQVSIIPAYRLGEIYAGDSCQCKETIDCAPTITNLVDNCGSAAPTPIAGLIVEGNRCGKTRTNDIGKMPSSQCKHVDNNQSNCASSDTDYCYRKTVGRCSNQRYQYDKDGYEVNNPGFIGPVVKIVWQCNFTLISGPTEVGTSYMLTGDGC